MSTLQQQAAELADNWDHDTDGDSFISCGNKMATLLRQIAALGKGEGLKDEQIRELFLQNGFTFKEGFTDLKPYCFAAAHDIESAATAPLHARIAELEAVVASAARSATADMRELAACQAREKELIERCAKVCETYAKEIDRDHFKYRHTSPLSRGLVDRGYGARECAREIRKLLAEPADHTALNEARAQAVEALKNSGPGYSPGVPKAAAWDNAVHAWRAHIDAEVERIRRGEL